MSVKEKLKKFWAFLKKDTWQSWLVSLILLIVIIKFIFFPALSLVTGTSLPLVIVESCSMYHSSDFNNFWDSNGAWYETRELSKSQFESFPLKNGLNKGDILLILGRTNVSLGDIIVFEDGSQYPLIHRVVSQIPLGTKGDHNNAQLNGNNNALSLDETKIKQSQIIGEAKVKVIPLLGWVKLIWFEPFKPKDSRGFCE